MKGKTSTGFKYEVSNEAYHDMELLDALIDADAGVPSGFKNALIHLIGEDGKKALYEHCRQENGIVNSDLVVAEFKEIIESMPKAAKNS